MTITGLKVQINGHNVETEQFHIQALIGMNKNFIIGHYKGSPKKDNFICSNLVLLKFKYTADLLDRIKPIIPHVYCYFTEQQQDGYYLYLIIKIKEITNFSLYIHHCKALAQKLEGEYLLWTIKGRFNVLYPEPTGKLIYQLYREAI